MLDENNAMYRLIATIGGKEYECVVDKENGLAKIKEHIANLKAENPNGEIPNFDENKKILLLIFGVLLVVGCKKEEQSKVQEIDDADIVEIEDYTSVYDVIGSKITIADVVLSPS